MIATDRLNTCYVDEAGLGASSRTDALLCGGSIRQATGCRRCARCKREIAAGVVPNDPFLRPDPRADWVNL